MKKIILKRFVFLCIFLVIISISMNAFCTDDIASYVGTIGNGTGGNDGGAQNAAKTILGTILNLVRIFGAAVAVIILLVIATKYIIASAGDRADIKKYAINYVIGALIFLGASGILTIIRDFILETSK